MPRFPVLRLAALFLVAAMLLPVQAARAGAWSTWIRTVTTNDMLAQRDTVLVATGEAGILRYLRHEDRFESVTREPGGLASNTVTAMTYDRSGRLWAGTKDKGVSRLAADDSKWDLVNVFDGLPSDTVTVLRADGDTIWIGTTRGIALWNGQVIAGSVPDIGTPSPFRSNIVTGIVVQADSLFVATADGLWQARLSQNLATWTEVDSGIPVPAIVALSTDGQRVFALAGGVVYVRSSVDGTWSATTIPAYVNRLRDDFGTVLALSPGGIYRWGGTQWVHAPGSWDSNGLGDLATDCAADPDGTIFEMYVQELLEQTTGNWIWRQPPGPVDNDVQNVLHDGTHLWVATHTGGMSRFDGTTWRSFPRYCCGPGQDTTYVNPQESMMLQLDAAGRLWSAHWESAIERADASTNPMTMDHVLDVNGRATEDTLSRHSDGWSSTLDAYGYLYIGGDTPSRGVLEPMGIDIYDPSGNPVINWKTTNAGLRSNQVRALSVDKYGILWAGFAGAGVSWAPLDTTIDSDRTVPGNDHRRLPAFQAISSLVSSDIFGVVAHGDSIWVLTTSELQRIRATTRLVTSLYDIPAGPAPRGAVHPLDVAPDGTVWVGSIEGVRRYQPGGGSVDYTTDNSPLANNEVRSVRVEPGTGAVWIGTASGVNRFDPHYQPPAPPAIARLSLKLWPNPATLTAMGAQLRLAANTPSVTGEVVDLGGRIVRRFSGVASGGVVWDGMDAGGTPVRPGVYFVHARGGGREAMARVVVLR